jgi:hypothetical protein
MSDESGFDFNTLFQQAQDMQQQLLEAQAQAADLVVEGQAGGGMVRVQLNGAFEFQGVEIAPEVIDPDDPEMLQDLVLAALHEAVRRVNEAQQQAMGGFDPTAVDLGGLDAGALMGGGAGELGAGEPGEDDHEAADGDVADD